MAALHDLLEDLQLSTILTHADHDLVAPGAAPVAPDISVTTSE
jgi:hypothetical protein